VWDSHLRVSANVKDEAVAALSNSFEFGYLVRQKDQFISDANVVNRDVIG